MPLPSDIYAGGAVSLNSLPYVQLYQQTQARKQAKQEALDNYYRDLSKSLTPAGMAANDVPDFTNKVNQWRDFTTKNRDILNNPRDKNYANTISQEQYLYNDALAHSEGSKTKVKDLQQFNQLRLSHPDYTITDLGMENAAKASLPLSKGYSPMDWASVEYNPKEAKINAAEILTKNREAIQKAFKMDKDISKPILLGLKTKAIEKTSSYSPESLQGMARMAHTLYNSDPNTKHVIDDLMNDPTAVQEADARFKQMFGADKSIQSAEDFAVAVLSPQQLTVSDTQPYAYSPTNITINSGQQAPLSVDNYINQLLQSANKRQYKPANGKWEDRYEIQPSPELSEMFAVKNGSKTYFPDQIQFNPQTGNWSSVFYKLNPDGTTAKGKNGAAAIDTELSKTYSNDAIRVRIADKFLGQKDVRTIMAQPSSNTQQKTTEKKSSTKTYKGLDKNGNPIFE